MSNLPPKRIKWSELLDDLTDTDRNRSIVVKRATETERIAMFLLKRDNWSVRLNSSKQKPYNLELFKYGRQIAGRVLNHRRKVSLSQIEKFVEFVSSESEEFDGGICISTSGFTRSVYSYLRDENIKNLKLAILRGNKLHWNCEEIEQEEERNRPTYIGVFTCKGGVGKTTIAAHLAGAFALNGYDISLIDLDRQRNMKTLLGDGVYLPARKGRKGARIDVMTPNEWETSQNKRTKYVICDCNPEFDANPIAFLRRFDFCIVPTSLNPLGINKNAKVISRTFELIRKVNTNAELFLLINNLQSDEAKRNALLNQVLSRQFKSLAALDSKCTYIDPEDVSIRFSKQLLYWGYHLYDGSTPTLAFRTYGKYSHPRMDFLKLVDFLEEHTGIEQVGSFSSPNTSKINVNAKGAS
ncbi:MAG: ParA family protein [Pyrinomonadaceae bacterium]|nr:ParA family protein [Pyrinomonadaceae bacterium]